MNETSESSGSLDVKGGFSGDASDSTAELVLTDGGNLIPEDN